MRVGVVLLPEFRWPVAEPLWRRAEELGFASAWTYDHMSWRSFRDSTWMAAVPTLTAAACVTDRIRLGTLVASPNFRHPATFAKDLVALDDVSGGRVTVGLGAGATSFDATVLGTPPLPPRERADRFAEFVEALDRFLTEPASSYRGKHFAGEEVRTYPGCVQQPRLPFAVAATGPRGMQLAARHGQAWVTYGDPKRAAEMTPAECEATVREQGRRLDEAMQAQGRDPASIDRILLTGSTPERPLASLEAFRDLAGRYAALGMTDLALHWPRPDEPYAGDLRVLEQVAGALPDLAAGRF
ncbi:LLM class flavin-dependent oxidoreductase [Motilibacter aurantiacus]|uniref:LLM class flavin-dependent oxidoreductase n=1 Tax=Motilibacter aurantiacus TaxID=2714955 RepID=UPI00140DCD15|nr:LLM class flavin-dependent oxidoreductase [Motilibacter aurantiacus]NHC46534.1 LLM class flavin-dependent oxidoreductase [Motilibacter aurantiacus]